MAVVVFVVAYQITSDDAVWLWRTEQVQDPSRPQPGAQLTFSATAYCKGDKTASGVSARTGVAAADPSILPVGSVVTVTTDNTRYNGIYTVMDTGPAVKGRELDLYLWSCTEALTFGRKDVHIEVLRLGWNPNASRAGLVERLFRRPRRQAELAIPEGAVPAATIPEPTSTEPTPADIAPLEGPAAAPEFAEPATPRSEADGRSALPQNTRP